MESNIKLLMAPGMQEYLLAGLAAHCEQRGFADECEPHCRVVFGKKTIDMDGKDHQHCEIMIFFPKKNGSDSNESDSFYSLQKGFTS